MLITLANMRTNLARNTLNIIHKAYGGSIRIFPHPVPYSTKVKAASAAGKSIFAYEPRGNAAYLCTLPEPSPCASFSTSATLTRL